MSSLRALVLCGEGINCETETAYALKTAGFAVEVSTINELIQAQFSQEQLQKNYQLFALPGGFSYGDELGSGRVLAIKIKRALKLDLNRFALNGGMVLGVCNGFQALIRLGVFGQNLTITRNSTHQFIDRWVELGAVKQNSSPWLKGIEQIQLPIRHGEGRLVAVQKTSALAAEFLPALQYLHDVNGSVDQLAGITDSSLRIFGLMPHPEAFVRWTQNPLWTEQKGQGLGLSFFSNAYSALKEG